MNIFFMNFKRNMKAAFITLKSNFKEYICFLIALVMVQMLFGVLSISFFNNRKVEKQIILDEGYDYHCEINDLDAADINILGSLYTKHTLQKDRTFEYRVNGNNYRIVFTDDYEINYQMFQNAVREMNEGYEHVSLQKTPLYDHEISAGGSFAALFPLLLVLMALSFFLITALFRIRLNHFKYTYGVYMTFGADTKKLFSSAFYEMLLIVLLSFPVSALLSNLVCALLYLPAGNVFGFYFAPLPIMLFCSLVCALLALILPIKLLGRSSPTKLLKAEDNSNLVSSARKSAKFLKSDPVRMELQGLWRFRRYIAILLLSTVSFAVVFVMGCYLSDAYAVRSDVHEAALTVKAHSKDIYNYFTAFLKANAEENDVDVFIEKSAADPYAAGGAREHSAAVVHLALDKSLVNSAYFTQTPAKEGYAATESLEIRAFDEDALACLSSVYGYTYAGEPEKLLTDPDAVILSSTLANGSALSVKPGDTVYLSTDYLPYPDKEDIEDSLITFDYLLENGVYVYRACTVAAVINNYADYDDMLVYLSTAESEGKTSVYEAVMGQKPDFTEARLHLKNEDDEKIAQLIVEDFLSKYGGIEFDRSYEALKDKISAAQNFRGLIVLLSALALAVSPLAGIFSQILFYGKRKLEFDVLRAVGAIRKDFLGVFLTDAAVLALLSGGLYAGVSFLAIRLACSFLNSRFAFIFTSAGTRASTFYPRMPLPFFFAGLVLTLLFAVFAVLLPAFLYKRSTTAHIATDFSKDDA